MKCVVFLGGLRLARREAVACGVAVVLLGVLLAPGAAEAHFTSVPPQASGCAVLSPDRTRVLTGAGYGKDDTARLWDAVTGECVVTLTGHKQGVRAVAFSADGKKALTGSVDGTAKLWDAATGVCLQTFTGHKSEVTSVAMSPDGTRVLTGADRSYSSLDMSPYDNNAKLWDAATGACVATLPGHTQGVWAVAFSPDGKTMLTGAEGGTVRLWDAAACTELRALASSEDAVPASALTFSPDGTKVLTGSWDPSAIVWDAATGALLQAFTRQTSLYSGTFNDSVAFSPDGTRALTGSRNGTVRLWDIAVGTCLRTFTGGGDNTCAVAFSADGAKIFASGTSGAVNVWDSDTQPLLRILPRMGLPSSVAFSPDGTKVLAGEYLPRARRHTEGGWEDITNYDVPAARLWDVVTGGKVAFFGHRGGVLSVAFSPDGTEVLTGSEDKAARLWDAATGKEKRSFTGHLEEVTCVAFSPDGTKVLTGSQDRTVKLWDAATGAELRTFAEPGDFVQSVAFSKDGSKILVGAGNWRATLWDAATGMEIGASQAFTTDANVAVFSPDGAWVLTGGGFPRTRKLTWTGWVDISESTVATARLWDAATGAEIRTFTGPTGLVNSAAFSPDGTRVVTAASLVRTNTRKDNGWVDAEDTTARLWDTATGAELHVLSGHAAEVASVAYSPDGATVLTGSKDGTARLWDAATGAEIHVYTPPPNRPDGYSEWIQFVAFSPDGTKLLTVAEHGTIVLWDARPAEPRRKENL